MIIVKSRFLVRLGLKLRRFCLFLADRLVTPQLALFERSIGLSQTMLISVVSELGVADQIASGPKSVEDLARNLKVNEDVLLRTLRALSDRGIFRLSRDRFLSHTHLSKALLANHPSALKHWAQYYGSESHVKAWADLRSTLKDGRSAFDRVFGETVWDYFARHPREEENFALAMMGVTRTQALVIEGLYDFARHKVICDIGGGRGTLLAYILEKNRGVQGVLMDARGVLASAEKLLRESSLWNRVSLKEGNFFVAVPEGADCYLLKNILHDWDDEVCLQILRNIRQAMKPDASLLLLEQLLGEFEPNPLASFSDVQMIMSCSNGRERSVEDFQKLLEKAGFKLHELKKHPIVSVLVFRKY